MSTTSTASSPMAKTAFETNAREGRAHQRYDSVTGSRLTAVGVPLKLDADGKTVLVLTTSSRKKGKARYSFPKGGWEDDENLVQCALRETWEEAGAKCEPLVLPSLAKLQATINVDATSTDADAKAEAETEAQYDYTTEAPPADSSSLLTVEERFYKREALRFIVKDNQHDQTPHEEVNWTNCSHSVVAMNPFELRRTTIDIVNVDAATGPTAMELPLASCVVPWLLVQPWRHKASKKKKNQTVRQHEAKDNEEGDNDWKVDDGTNHRGTIHRVVLLKVVGSAWSRFPEEKERHRVWRPLADLNNTTTIRPVAEANPSDDPAEVGPLRPEHRQYLERLLELDGVAHEIVAALQNAS